MRRRLCKMLLLIEGVQRKLRILIDSFQQNIVRVLLVDTDINPSKETFDAATPKRYFPTPIFTFVVSYTAEAILLAAKRFQIS